MKILAFFFLQTILITIGFWLLAAFAMMSRPGSLSGAQEFAVGSAYFGYLLAFLVWLITSRKLNWWEKSGVQCFVIPFVILGAIRLFAGH